MNPQRKNLFLTAGGLLFLLLGECAILLRNEALKVWVTPFCWTGYILLVDSYLFRKRGSSLFQDYLWQMLLTFPISTALWLIFGGYNLLLKNWEYLNIPSHPLLKYPGFAWSFGTILPALFETVDLLEYKGIFKEAQVVPSKISKNALVFSFFLGFLFLIYPLFVASPCDFPAVWLGFVFLLEPVNYSLGKRSLLKQLEKGKAQRLCTLLLTGGIMGFLWEFWNFWAGAKWIYHIPVPKTAKIFEMPLLGFLGFFPFAVEFYIMYHFVLPTQKFPLPENR